jgi:uncharacterized membrane protein YfcA
MTVRVVLLVLMSALAIGYAGFWIAAMRKRGFVPPKPLQLGIGFITDFLDTLGIGSFAPTTTMFKLWRLVPDERIPGTLNAGHATPTVVEALVFIGIVAVAPVTLCLMIAAAIIGAWLGAGVVAKWPRRYVQVGMGVALLVAAVLFVMSNLGRFPAGGNGLELTGLKLAIGVGGNFILGALMTLGIGLYAPCMILVSLLGMSPIAAFPIMMGSCAFLMPVASLRFIRLDSYSLPAALGLAIGGIPGVLVAAFIVKSLPITALRWLVAAVVLYAAFAMLRSAIAERRLRTVEATTNPA